MTRPQRSAARPHRSCDDSTRFGITASVHLMPYNRPPMFWPAARQQWVSIVQARAERLKPMALERFEAALAVTSAERKADSVPVRYDPPTISSRRCRRCSSWSTASPCIATSRARRSRVCSTAGRSSSRMPPGRTSSRSGTGGWKPQRSPAHGRRRRRCPATARRRCRPPSTRRWPTCSSAAIRAIRRVRRRSRSRFPASSSRRSRPSCWCSRARRSSCRSKARS